MRELTQGARDYDPEVGKTSGDRAAPLPNPCTCPRPWASRRVPSRRRAPPSCRNRNGHGRFL